MKGISSLLHDYQLGFKTRETPNSDLSVCLAMVGIRAFNIFCNALILSLQDSCWVDMRSF
jgi:hypothetical protein